MLRRLSRIFALLLAVIASTVCNAQVTVAIRNTTVKAYRSPDAQSALVATLHKNETFIIVDDVRYYYKIRLKNRRLAYVAKSACTVVGEAEGNDDTGSVGTNVAAPNLSPPTAIPGCSPQTVKADWNVCPQDGSGGIYAELYKLKNRVTIPCQYSPITVADILALPHLPHNVRSLPDDDPQLQQLQAIESRAVVVDSYLAMVKDGGKEGVNCNSTTRLDVHAELIDTDDDPAQNRPRHVVSEVTPWFSAAIHAWTKDNLAQYSAYANGYSAAQVRTSTKVRIYGYLMYDEAHAGNGAVRQWRGTAWEIHPITRIEVCGTSGCSPIQ